MNLEAVSRKRFLEDYRCVRHAEGRGSEDSAYYQTLPFCDPSDRNAAMWQMRARTFKYFEKNVLSPIEASVPRPLDILDLGAGNCWLSNRLSLRHHRVVALDIFSDSLDGLGAARHYSQPFSIIEADFSQLPFFSSAFDLIVFNASFHYSTDYAQTLAEVRRCLRPSGLVAILDSPFYRTRGQGIQMVKEKQARFLRQYGFRSDAIPSLEFLHPASLESLQRVVGVRWRIFKPWYGLPWHLRPAKAWLLRHRAPSRFWIFTGMFESK